MSGIATFTMMPAADLPGLREAATPKRGLLGKSKDGYPAFLSGHGREVADYPWSGFVLATLLVYLQEHGIDLMTGDHDELGADLVEARGTTHFILTPAHRDAYLARLDAGSFAEDELRDYYNEFNEVDEPDAGAPMLDGVRAFAQALEALDDDSVVVFEIS